MISIKTQPKKSRKPAKNHPWRANARTKPGGNNSNLHHTRISSFNRMGIRI